MGLSQLNAEGVIWHSSPTKSTAESQSATKKYNLIIEIRKNFYLKTAFTINFLTAKAVSCFFFMILYFCSALNETAPLSTVSNLD